MTPSFLRRAASLALLTWAAAGCGQKPEAGPRAQPPAPVSVATVIQKTMPEQLAAVGNVTPINTVAMRPQVSGVIQKVAFLEGKEVKKGDVLFEIDPRPALAAVAAAQSALERDRAQAERARADARRYSELVQKQYVTVQQHETAKATAEALEATVKVDEATLQKARLDLAYCTIRSPIDGRTGSLLAQAGNLAQPSSASALVSITQLRPIYVAFSIPEAALPRVRSKGEAVKVVAQVPGGAAAHEGRVTFIDNSVNPSTGTILLKATFANADEALWPGQFVNVTATLGERADVMVVPAVAVQHGQQGSFVYVVKADDSAELRPVVVGPADAEEAIIEKGLAAGETVVTDGQLRVVPGSKVQIKNRGTAAR